MKLTDVRVLVADDVVDHLLLRVVETGAGNPLRDRYVGFCAVTAATHVETIAKDIILDFCHAQNAYLHAVITLELKSFNAKISYADLCKFLKRLDPAMECRFKSLLNRLNRRTLRTPERGFDLFQAYESILGVRHQFVHNLHASFAHVTEADLRNYIYASKRMICAFGRTLSV